MEIMQIAQRATDLPRAIAFYEKLLGRNVDAVYEGAGLAFFVLGSVRLLLDVGAPSALLYLRVDDVRGRIETLRAEGVPIAGEPQVIFTHPDDTLGPQGSEEWMGFITDSEGNTVGLVTQQSNA